MQIHRLTWEVERLVQLRVSHVGQGRDLHSRGQWRKRLVWYLHAKTYTHPRGSCRSSCHNDWVMLSVHLFMCISLHAQANQWEAMARELN
jgi:hypothetical protein